MQIKPFPDRFSSFLQPGILIGAHLVNDNCSFLQWKKKQPNTSFSIFGALRSPHLSWILQQAADLSHHSSSSVPPVLTPSFHPSLQQEIGPCCRAAFLILRIYVHDFCLLSSSVCLHASSPMPRLVEDRAGNCQTLLLSAHLMHSDSAR